VGKPGYSTVAEIYYAGIPFAYVPREHFRETAPLTRFIVNTLSGFEIKYQEFISGGWVGQIPQLFEYPRQERCHINGAEEIAQYICRAFIDDLQ